MNIEELARQERQEYYRKWRAENKDSVKKYNADYWRRRAERKIVAQNSRG